MKTWMSRTLFALGILGSTLGGFGSTGGPPDTIRIAVLPCNNIEITFRKFYPLLTYLRRETGLAVKLVVPNDLEDFSGSVKSGRIDFALQDPHTYAGLSLLFNRARLLRTLTLDGRSSQSGVVVARRDSGITRLEDLRGRTVLFGPKASTPKWVAAKMLFASKGIDIEKDLKSHGNGGCCEDIAFSVFMKSVDAGMVCEHFLAEHEEKQRDLGMDAGKLMIIARTRYFPTRVFAARNGLQQETVDRIYRALLSLDSRNPEHARILFRGEIGGFQPGNDADYRDLAKALD